jgi:hypothetical protein
MVVFVCGYVDNRSALDKNRTVAERIVAGLFSGFCRNS